MHAKFECTLTTLHEVSDIFKCRIDFFSEDEIEVVKTLCKLEKILANWFSHSNLTPKGNGLVWVLPEIIKHTQSFFMFYKVEEKSIHAELNFLIKKLGV